MTQSNGALTNAELSEFVRVHNTAIAHHQQWLTDHQAAVAKHDQEIEQIRAQQQLNTQDISELRASITDLRNIVADYIQGRYRD